MPRPIIVYTKGIPAHGFEGDAVHTAAIIMDAHAYDNGKTIRLVIPGASHSSAWTMARAEA